ncbi:hypothetical protein DL764_009888 [Monosporascus ibericus]|uniref:Alpha/beta hydrolase fold-3 domain-containing protein n=1 Tax=Monosporascus ibericus TaxID=155417 RepID=A0A4Q4SWN2_9PEZI|nr:hypothetical protein DL764_009888 [Monosporascus ibericus]
MSTQDGEKKQGWLDSSRLEALFTLLPKIPLIVRVALLHLLSISESSRYLDMKSDVTISVLRCLLDPSEPGPISKTQAMTLRDPGIKGRIWVSKVASNIPPENHIRDTLLAAVDGMKEQKSSTTSFRIPDIASVQAEWTGYRAKAARDSPPPAISEEEKYREMMKECKSSPTILYFHGGAYYLCDPSTHRPCTKRLAKLTGGRVYSVRYRLAPQHPFPSALLDALVSYFTLLYPPPGSLHEAVAASDIVFGGDSAGGNLSLVLLQTLLEVRRQGRKITWFGEEREVPLPAAVTASSPWLDIVQSMPSWGSNSKWDYLPPKSTLAAEQPPPDDVWPANPPRRHLYVDDAYLLHPLVSLQLNRSWEGSPPIYICCGWECLADEDKYLVSKLIKDSVPVVFEEYEAMPHVFPLIIPHRPESRRNLQGWSNFIKRAVDDATKIEPSYTTIKAKTLQEVAIDTTKLSPYSEEDVRDMARDRVGREQLTEVSVKL